MGGVCGDGGGSFLIPGSLTSIYSVLRVVTNVNLTKIAKNEQTVRFTIVNRMNRIAIENPLKTLKIQL